MKLRNKTLLGSAIFIALVVGSVMYFELSLQESANEVVATNITLTQTAVHQLAGAGEKLIDSLTHSSFFFQQTLTRVQERKVDSLLATITAGELGTYRGVEGGFYFLQLDQFFGYSFPTSPPPEPVFGPPPRSFNIIRDQARQSIVERKRIERVHQFDPATFPLVTEPIIIRGEVVGCVWGRIHIERLIPTFSLTTLLIVGGALALIGFAIAVGFAWNMRRRAEEIRRGLDTLHTNVSYRFRTRNGAFGFIMDSINEMVDAREKMEREMHQQDKMATLGALVAGVAHEVKTPLAIIKTRIQMWEKKFRERNRSEDDEGVVSRDSIKLVIGEINRLSALVKRLLVFSKPLTNTLKPANVNLLLQQTVTLIQSEAEEKKVDVQIDLERKIPAVNLDVQSMEQVVLNIFSNSLDAMPDGGTLRIGSEYLEMEHTVRIEIEDTGKGIPADIADKIFNPFFTTKDHGVGLGLSISYEIVRAHHGKIEFVQPNGHGTICRIHIPTSNLTKEINA